jgi:dienelactone hydrolase
MRGVAAVLVAAFVSTAAGAAAQGRIEFPTLTFETSTAVFSSPGRQQTGAGTLRLPDGTTGKLPLVILGHTISGWRDDHEGWFARELNKLGFATFEVDVFGPRQARDTMTQVGAWANMTATSDLYHALKLLTAHPRIDPARIAVVGFSMGGEAAHLAAFEPVAKRLAPDGPRFAAHVSLYPLCTTAANPAGGAYTGAPVLLLLGEKDEAGPPDGCRRIVSHFQSQGKRPPVEIVVYPGAYHAWTNAAINPPRFHAMNASPGKCPVMLIGPPLFLDANGSRPFRPADLQACLQQGKGYMMGYDGPTRDRSLADLAAFLKKHLRA